MMEKLEVAFNTGFIKNNNYKVISVDENSCIVEAMITDTSLNPFGITHGGYVFGLADTTAGILANVYGNAVTTNSSINYLNKGKGQKLVAEAKFLKRGISLSTCECVIYDEEKKVVAKATLEYYYIGSKVIK